MIALLSKKLTMVDHMILLFFMADSKRATFSNLILLLKTALINPFNDLKRKDVLISQNTTLFVFASIYFYKLKHCIFILTNNALLILKKLIRKFREYVTVALFLQIQ
jgi:hypothetical protein